MRGRELFGIETIDKVETPFCLVFVPKVNTSTTCFFTLITSVKREREDFRLYGNFIMRYDDYSCGTPLIYRREIELTRIPLTEDNVWAFCKPTKNDYSRILNELISRIYDVDTDLQRRIIKFVKHFKYI